MYKVELANQALDIETKDGETYINKELVSSNIVSLGNNKLNIIINNQPIETELLSIDKENKSVSMMINNQKVEVKIKDSFDLLLHDLGLDSLAAKKVSDIKAPMPGLVLKVLATDGQTIKKGENLLILEAMKMENMLKAADDCVIKKILVNPGDKVEKNQILIQLEA
ncbi:MAG: acetyl-CoA carboxylase biotin carboxyl carrier protein subunit [Bacteroidetes bacterium]|nr:acetyl-CoA carboxylase biotin carboxyl carrier protein subunit [Bacteroidota bacterium]